MGLDSRDGRASSRGSIGFTPATPFARRIRPTCSPLSWPNPSLDKKLRLELNQRTNLELFACAESNQLVADATVTMLLALGLPPSLAALAPLQPLLGGSIERMIAEYSFNQW